VDELDVGQKTKIPFAIFAMNLFRSIAFSILLSVTLGSSCSSTSSTTDRNENAKATKFKSDLIAAVSKAHRIDVVEHSWLYDFYDGRGELIKDPPQIDYKRTQLTPEQKASFYAVLEKMAESPKTMFAACIFEPHHSIELIRDNGKKSVIRICFKCDDTEWDGSDGTAPEVFQKEVQQFIAPLGFQVSRDWHELAKKSAQQDAPSNGG
jgi:hypothetical protein